MRLSGLTQSYVVFTDQATWMPLKILKRGYRHCFFLGKIDQDQWLIIEPLLHKIDIRLMAVNPTENFRMAGYHIVKADMKECHSKNIFVGLTSCVGIIKKIIGIKGFMIITPYQLVKTLRA
jgi:hypothetical protein